jgi:hypothetical protein
MPALNGETISTITDGTGTPVFVMYEFYDPATGNLRDAMQSTSTGLKTGALIVDNMTGVQQTVTATRPPLTVKTFTIPATGAALTVAQLAANKSNNGGPITTYADLAGLSLSLT